MRIEIIIFIISGLIIANIYTDGKYLKLLLSYKKYYQIGGVIIATLFLYWLLKKNPASCKELLLSSNEYIKYLPVDRNVSNLIEPLVDFTSKKTFVNDDYNQPIINLSSTVKTRDDSNLKTTKRSVSDSKKKFIASKQGWKCKECHQILPATFEVDHIIRLQYGGSNEINNLQALCPNCHRNKTLIETL